MNLKESKDKLEATNIPSEVEIGKKKNKLAIIPICEVNAFHAPDQGGWGISLTRKH